MAIRADSIAADIAAIAAITQTPGRGATRPTFSREWGRARDYVIAEARKVGCVERIDAAGNVFAKPASLPADQPTWLCGSHLDTVPHGGDYDGVAGVVTALELLRSARDDGVVLPLELVIFAEEEGPTFGLGMLGSRAMVGELTADQLAALKNKDGQTYLQAGAPYGVDGPRLAASRLRPEKHLGLIELHIEQGPAMWKENRRLAVVTAIAGRRQYKAKFIGCANHAGSTPMSYRTDALVSAAHLTLAVESLARELGPPTVATVGRLDIEPNAINVIPGTVRMTVDVRSPSTVTLEEFERRIHEKLIGELPLVEFHFGPTEEQPPVPMSLGLVDALKGSAALVGLGDIPTAVSGALHDSAVLAPHLPTVMLFVPSKDGISHNPAEFSRVEDVAAGAGVIEQLVRRPTLATLNAMGREAFVAAIGRTYEHSPWVAERAAAARPFASIDELTASMTRVVRAAPRDEQLALIRAHPDLVRRMTGSPSHSREGAGGRGDDPGDRFDSPTDRPPPQPSPASGGGSQTVTRESVGEQHAAGLTSLSEGEVSDFERYNAAYRERFGFPFVICARQNKKDAILAAFPRRLANDVEAEIATALTEIDKIAALRLADALWNENKSPMTPMRTDPKV